MIPRGGGRPCPPISENKKQRKASFQWSKYESGRAQLPLVMHEPTHDSGVHRTKSRGGVFGARGVRAGERDRDLAGVTESAGRDARRQCVHETMNSMCESHNHPGGRNRGAVEGNCVAARRGGEQPETDRWSQTKVNSIRRSNRASLLAKGEACRDSGEPVTVQALPRLETGRLGRGWSENGGKGTWVKWRDRRGGLTRVGVRGSIVAKHRDRLRRFGQKPGNAGGAKGPRKVNAR